MEPSAGTFLKNVNVRIVFRAGFTFHFNSSHAGREKKGEVKKYPWAIWIYSALRPCSGLPLNSLSPGTAVVEPRHRIYVAVPKVMCLSIFLFKEKKSSKQEHTSPLQKKPQIQAVHTQKSRLTAKRMARGEVIMEQHWGTGLMAEKGGLFWDCHKHESMEIIIN